MKKRDKIIITSVAIITISILAFLLIPKNIDDAFTGEVKRIASLTYSDTGVTYVNPDRKFQFVDLETGKNIILCDKPNCQHNDKTCNADIDDLIEFVAVYNDKIYFITMEGSRRNILYKADINGRNRRAIIELGEIQSIYDVIIKDNYLIISYTKEFIYEEDSVGFLGKVDKPLAGIAIIDLKEETLTLIPEKSDYYSGSINKLYTYQDKIFYVYS